MPGGPAAMRQVTLRWDQSGWEFFSAGAAKVTTLEGSGREGKRALSWCSARRIP